jgi:hypothetical protein
MEGAGRLTVDGGDGDDDSEEEMGEMAIYVHGDM